MVAIEQQEPQKPSAGELVHKLEEHQRSGVSLSVGNLLGDIYQIVDLGYGTDPQIANRLKRLGQTKPDIIGNSIADAIKQTYEATDLSREQRVDQFQHNIQALIVLGLDKQAAGLIGVLVKKFPELNDRMTVPKPQKTFSRRKLLGAGGWLATAALTGGIGWLSRYNRDKPASQGVPLEANTKLAGVPTRVVTQAPAVTPSPTNTAEPTQVTERQVDLIDEFLKPFVEEAVRKRAERMKNDPQYLPRVDQELNSNRVNFLIMGFGEEHGQTYEDMGGSVTIMSYNTQTHTIDSVSLSRDVRTPEVRGKLPADRTEVIRNAYKAGGFDLLRKVAENASGLAVDFQIVIKDVLIQKLMKDVIGSVEIDVEKEHKTQGFRLGGKDYPPGYIPAGKQTMDATQAMYFIMAEEQQPLSKKDERLYRKNALMRAIQNKLLTETSKNPTLVLNVAKFVLEELTNGDFISEDGSWFVLRVLDAAKNTAFELAKNLGRIKFKSQQDNKQEIIISDSAYGDGGVSRVHKIRDFPNDKDRQDKPTVKKEIAQQYLPDWMLIPDGGDPSVEDHELASKYWQSVRKLVKKVLS